jgi:hypothetical protein
LRVKDIRKIIEAAEAANEDNFMENIADFLPLASDLTLEEADEMAPSELKIFWDTMRDVNSDFLSVIESLGIMGALGKFLRGQLTDAFADL